MNKKTWLSALAFLLAAPVVMTLAACDTSSKPSSSCASGKTGLAAAATCSPTMTGKAPGMTNSTPTTPTTPTNPTTPTTTPTTGTTGGNAELIGDWGISNPANGRGQVWTFSADGTYAVVSYALVTGGAQVEVTVAGKFTAANGQLSVTADGSSCARQLAPDMLPYTVSGNTFTVTIEGQSYSYMKGNAPSENLNYTVGCFGENGTFTPTTGTGGTP